MGWRGSVTAPLPEDGFGLVQRVSAKDLRAFGDCRGCPACAPLIPLRLDTPARLETSQDFGGTGGRAGADFLPGIQKPAPAR